MTLEIWVNIGSGNGLLPVNIKPLPEPMLTYHQRYSVTFTLAISQQVLRMISICEIGVKIVPSKLVTCLQGTNELVCLNINCQETYIDQSQHNIYFVISTFILWLALFTRGQFWPVVLSLPASVCLSVCQPRACPCNNSSPLQARTTKLGQKMQNTLVKIPIVFGVDWPWPVRSNLT